MSPPKPEDPQKSALTLSVNEDSLSVDLADGRTITVPVAWFPRLAHGTAGERSNWRFIGNGEGIHWRELDEEISIATPLAGRRSGESQESLGRWLKARESQA